MITRAYIHEYGNGNMEPEHAAVAETLRELGISVELFTTKRLQRNQLQLDQHSLVVGDHPTIALVLKRLGIAYSETSYPECLLPFLGRRIWSTTCVQLLRSASSQTFVPFFVKPKNRTKLFTGFVIESDADLLSLNHFPKDTELNCSEVVHFVSEYRVYVIGSEIAGMDWYAGSEQPAPDKTVIENAITIYGASENAARAYALDFGVTETGETLLIEWNDGFALGCYAMDRKSYTQLVLTRWEQLLENRLSP